MEDKTLITLPKGEVPTVFNESDFDESTKTGAYLPRLQLMTSSSDVCKAGDFPVNHFALVRDQNYKDLGTEVNLLVLAWRPKALQMGDEIISVFDTKDPEFARIRELSTVKDSKAMYGPEYLVWIGGAECFATFFMGTKSMRREASVVQDHLEKSITLKPAKIQNSKYTWFSPKAERCTTIFRLPENEEQDQMEEEYKKFMSPPKKTVERVSEEEKSDRVR